MKRYVYFFSYYWTNSESWNGTVAVGMASMTLTKKITTFSQLANVAKNIARDEKIKECIILNYQLLRVEDSEDN